MNIYLRVFLVLQLYAKISSQKVNIEENNINKLNEMDVLMEDLLHQHWETEEAPCLNKLLDIINNVKNSTLWATWVWDSMQVPTGVLYGSQYSLGNYDQCMNSPWLETHPEFRTQYCLADIKLSDTDPTNTIGDPYISVTNHINTLTKHRLQFNKLTLGVCVPAECKTKSTNKFVRSFLKNTHLGHYIYKIDVDNCQVAGTSAEYTWGFFILVFFLISLIIATVSCTIINSKKTSKTDDNENKFLKAFCLTTNISSLNKLSKDDINVLHGLRTLSSFAVICLHVVFFSHSIGFGNSLTLETDLDRFKIKALLRLDYTVDIFLLMSGMLRIKSYMNVGKINPLKAILKRYMRYVVTIGVIILCIIEVQKHVGNGPIWNLMGTEESKACSKNGLITLFMLGNYVDNQNICYPVLWTVPCDFHWSVTATILYWIFTKNKKSAIIIYGVLVLASLILPGIVTYQQDLLKILAFDFTITGNYKKMISTSTYIMSHLRGGPYLIGMALGYFMSVYKPNRHRNMISKSSSLIGIIFALTIVAIDINVVGSVQDNPNSNDLSSFVVSSTHRFIFTIAICCVIVICEYGNVPLLGSVLTWPALIPISKISYGIYLVHIMIYSRMIATTRSPLLYDALLMVIHSFSVISMSCAVALVLYLLLEAPTNKITDIMIDIKADTEKKYTNGTAREFKKSASYSNCVKKNK